MGSAWINSSSCFYYYDLFGLELILDNDGNMILTEGLVLQEEKYWKRFLILPNAVNCRNAFHSVCFLFVEIRTFDLSDCFPYNKGEIKTRGSKDYANKAEIFLFGRL